KVTSRLRILAASILGNYEPRAAEVQTGMRVTCRCMWILQSPISDSDALTFRLSPGAVKTIGRATNADLILDAAMVSRVHCRLEASAETLEVVDLDSTNGTYVNGARILRAHLIPGDKLRVGRVELAVGRTE